MVQVMDKKPDDIKKTWRQLLVELSEGKLKDPVVQKAFADSFEVDIRGLNNQDTQETLFEFIHVHVPVDRWDEVAIWPLPPRKVDKLTENEKNLWTAIAALCVALVLVFMVAIFSGGGVSKSEINKLVDAKVQAYDIQNCLDEVRSDNQIYPQAPTSESVCTDKFKSNNQKGN